MKRVTKIQHTCRVWLSRRNYCDFATPCITYSTRSSSVLVHKALRSGTEKATDSVSDARDTLSYSTTEVGTEPADDRGRPSQWRHRLSQSHIYSCGITTVRISGQGYWVPKETEVSMICCMMWYVRWLFQRSRNTSVTTVSQVLQAP